MKIMIASDIHGSTKYCRKMMEAYRREQPDRLLLLGDLLYHGPRNGLPEEYDPKEVIEMLNSIRDHILCVKGNCDTEVDQMVLDFPIMADYCTMYLDQPRRMIFATHGHHFHKDALPPLQPGDILLHGHTHVPAWERVPMGDDAGKDSFVWYMNPGSVSLPKGGSQHGYMMLESEEKTRIRWKDLEGNVYNEIMME